MEEIFCEGIKWMCKQFEIDRWTKKFFKNPPIFSKSCKQFMVVAQRNLASTSESRNCNEKKLPVNFLKLLYQDILLCKS